jgi:valyl-tRNA synthetase
MEIPAKYDPATTEDRWYAHWIDKGYFHSIPDERPAYCVVIPPPNVTGVLHMGHMLNNTIQDVLVRRARMRGYNACWVPGTDHASIATEAKVVRKLREEGIKKADLSRVKFLEHAWAWTDKHGGIILQQLRKLGASCDWERTRFTMDEKYYESVIDTFIDLFDKGFIYRGARMINWDPAAKTALSDEEVIHKEVNSKLYHVKYRVAGCDEMLTIATTRPETILGDTAVCIHPEDERYTHLHGKRAIVPLIDREVPIVLDDYVDREFGTGCLKVTPAHDVNDYELGKKHGLETIDVMNADGTMSPAAQLYIGMDRFAVRKQIVKDLEEAGHIAKIEEYKNKVGYSERTDVVIEPRLSLQWWVSMKELAKPATEAVLNGDVKFYPEKFVNTYRHWMENIKDWCISRQLWWGHRIPAYYFGEGEHDFVIAKTPEAALEKARIASGNDVLTGADLWQDEDVLDTWFSSWLWPISVFDGLYSEEEVKYYYPTADLVTAPEIMFFWVARMIIAGYYYRGEKPFSNVYYTGIVRDKLGRKMSKSLGNSPDPLDLIAKYGADGVRVGMLLCSPAGNDLPFDEGLCEQGRNFSNKIWNAFRLVNGWETEDKAQPQTSALAYRWMRSRLSKSIAEMNDAFEKFRISEALMTVYKLIWDDFCSMYLEMIKPPFGSPIDLKTKGEAIAVFEELLKLLHPFMPFISEDLWQRFADRKTEDALVITSWPDAGHPDERLLAESELVLNLIAEVRNHRNSLGISPKQEVSGSINISGFLKEEFSGLLAKLANATIDIKGDGTDVSPRPNGVLLFAIDDSNKEDEREKLLKELDYLKGFLVSVNRKLSNEKFMAGAPADVVENERKKQSDAEEKIKGIEERLGVLNG